MQRRVGEALISMAAIGTIVAVLARFDPRVGDALSAWISGDPQSEIAAAISHFSRTASIVAAVAREQSVAHAPLAIFTAAAAVLLVFMLRT